MSKGSRQTRITIDEVELIELVKHNPELYECSHRQAKNDSHIENLWVEIAEKLNAPVENVKRKWKYLKEAHGRRTSLRSTPNLNFLSLPLVELSNENSRTSSNCSSPKGDGKRSTRSVSQLSTASEAERTHSTLLSSTATLLKQTDSRRSRMDTPIREDTSSIADIQSVETNARSYRDRELSLADIPRPRLSDSSFLSSKEVLQRAVSLASRSLAETPTAKNKMKKNNASGPTRTFFESMAMTVATFPQHIQATIKLQICNIVQETEYGLSIPKPC